MFKMPSIEPLGTGAITAPVAPVVQPQTVKTVPQYTGGANNPQQVLDYLAQAYTTPQREEEIRKASVMNQRIAAVADALRHIGNIYNTTRYAPSQQFNNPVGEEYNRYLQGKSMRDAANQRYLSYQQQKAAQDARMAKEERDYQLKVADDARKEALNDARISRYNAQNAKDAEMQAYWATRAKYLEEGWPLEKALKEARRAQAEASARKTNIQADQGGYAPKSGGGGSRGGSGRSSTGGYTETTEITRDANGRETGRKKTKTPTGTYDQQKGVKGFSIHSPKKQEAKKSNVGSFSIHKK